MTFIPPVEVPSDNPAESHEVEEVMQKTQEALSHMAEEQKIEDAKPLQFHPMEVARAAEKARRQGQVIPLETVAKLTQRIPYEELRLVI